MTNAAAEPEVSRSGLGYALLAYLWWGTVIPIWFWIVQAVGAWDLLALRLLLGLPLLALLVSIGRQWPALRAVPRNPAARWRLPLTAILLAANWFGYVYATVNARTLEASLGYFTNPLVSVALGAIFLGERLRPAQRLAVTLAAVGVTVSIIAAVRSGGAAPFPWITLTLAFSFGLYGLLRKQADVPAMVGLTAELMVLAPVGLVLLVWRVGDGAIGAWTALEPWRFGVLMLAGVITLAPLVWFNSAARRLPLKTLGLLQYLAPTGQFFIALWLYDEVLTPPAVITFALVWSAVTLYCVDLARAPRRPRPTRSPETSPPAAAAIPLAGALTAPATHPEPPGPGVPDPGE